MIEDTGKGYTLKKGGRYLASPYAPRDKAEKIAHRSRLLDKCIYIVPSPLFGYGLNILIEKIPLGSYILCIEQDQEVMSITSSHFPQKTLKNEKLDYIRSDNPAQIIEYLRQKGWGHFRKCDLFLLNGHNPDKSFYNSLLAEIQQHLNAYWKNRITMIELGNRWISNIIRNIKRVDDSKPFPYTNKPLIICGAGASLSNCLTEIIPIREDYYLLSVDTALPALKERGVKPDAIVNLDGQYYNSLDFYPLDDSIYTLSDLTAYPSTLREGSFSLFLSRFCETDLLDVLEKSLGIPSLPALGSVGVSAFELACRISSGPIILCGLDFAYIPGASHVKGSIFHQYYLNNHKRLTPDADLLANVFKRRTTMLKLKHMRSDSLLKSYHDQLMAYIKKKGRSVYSWKQKGLPLGLNEWVPEKMHPKEASIEKRKQKTEHHIKKENVSMLLSQWEKMMQHILDLWEKYRTEDTGLNLLLEALNKADFLYLGSPITPPEPCEDPKVLTLLILRCRQLLALIQKLYR